MSKTKFNDETLISRIMLMLVGFFVLSLFTLLYVVPFKKTTLQINYYYKIIEYVVMAVIAVGTVLVAHYSKKLPKTSLITPSMCNILSLSALASAFIIPLSGSRVRFSKICILAYFFVFLAYTVYYFVNKAFAIQTGIFGLYFIMLLLMDKLYTTNVTFEEKITLSYTMARIIFAAIILLVVFAAYKFLIKINGFVLWHTLALSAVSAITIVVRSFVYSYVILVSLIVLSLVYIALAVCSKMAKKHK